MRLVQRSLRGRDGGIRAPSVHRRGQAVVVPDERRATSRSRRTSRPARAAGCRPASRTSRARSKARSPVRARLWTRTAASTERWRTAALRPAKSGLPSSRTRSKSRREPGQGSTTRPGLARNSRGRATGARSGRRLRWSSGASIRASVRRDAVLDHVVEPDLGPQPELPGEHRAGQVGVDQQGPPGAAGQGPGQGQDEGRPALGAVAAREEEDLQVLPVAGRDQGVGQPREPVAVAPLQGPDGRRPVERRDRSGPPRSRSA